MAFHGDFMEFSPGDFMGVTMVEKDYFFFGVVPGANQQLHGKKHMELAMQT